MVAGWLLWLILGGEVAHSVVHPRWESVCGDVLMRTGTGISFSSEERFLICGDTTIPAWDTVSLAESRYYLRIALETKAYPRPVFYIQDNVLYVEPGPKAVLKEFFVQEGEQRRRIPIPPPFLSRDITPGLLNSMSAWLTNDLQERGWPCPEVTLEVLPGEDSIVANVSVGEKLAFSSVDVDGSGPDAVVARQMAFDLGDPYDRVSLRLSEARLINSEQIRSAFLRHKCTEDGVEVYGEAVAAPGRLIRLGAGLNSETWFNLRAIWQNARLGELASTFAAKAEASRQVQSLEGSLQWYPWEQYPKHHLFAEARVEHHWEQYSRWLRLSVNPAARLVFETFLGRTALSAGPELVLVRGLEGPGMDASTAIELKVAGSVTSNAYELYRLDPRTGGYLAGGLSLSPRTFGSTVDFLRYNLEGSHYWTLFDTGTPFFLFMFRAELLGTSLLSGARDRLPTDAFYYLGGQETIRGFPRNSLPDADGALTRLSLVTEWIFRGAIQDTLDPYFFIDFGKTGNSLSEWDPETYWTPGMGLRWRSPIGPVSVSVGHGFSTSGAGDPGWQAYVSLGEEF